MRSNHPDFSVPQAGPSLSEPDITHEIGTVLRAIIIFLAILMTTVLVGAAIKSLALG